MSSFRSLDNFGDNTRANCSPTNLFGLRPHPSRESGPPFKTWRSNLLRKSVASLRCTYPYTKNPANAGLFVSIIETYSIILATTPAPTVRPPSRIAKRKPSSIAIGAIKVTSIWMLSPGITISTPSGSSQAPVTSVVRK
jgi:hypothetical protein